MTLSETTDRSAGWRRLSQWNASPRMSELEALMWRGERHPDFSSTGVVIEVLSAVPDWDRFNAAFTWAVRTVPRLRQRVVEPLLLTGPPAWVDDAHFDLGYHVRRVLLPAPATQQELLDFGQVTGATPLDRTRPLWTCSLAVLGDGRAGLVLQAHHCLMDGAAMIELLTLMHSDRPQPSPDKPTSPSTVASVVDPAALSVDDLVGAARSAPSAALQLVAGATRVLRDPEVMIELVGSLRRVLSPPPGTQPSPLLRRWSGRAWRFGVMECTLTALKSAGRAAHGSVNDAYMAALLGGIRIYHEAKGIELGAIPMGMPVSIRHPDDPSGGNRFAAAMLAGPAGEPDPAERIASIRAAVVSARAEPAIDALGHLSPMLNRLPPPLLHQALKGIPRVDLSGSNIPGMPQVVYAAGSPVDGIYIFGPLPGVSMMATLISYAGTCFIGMNVDGAVYDDTQLLWTSMRKGLDEVLALGEGHPTTGAPRRVVKRRKTTKSGAS